MRIIPFREVLHAIAYKNGMDPQQGNFITDEAIPIGRFIDQWMRRSYDAQDWPEWTLTQQFTPTNHVVAWDYTAVIGTRRGVTLTKLGRILAVYLIDPRTTNAPVETDYTLQDDGVHVGYEHGSSVWIEFIAPAPRFTAEAWNSSQVYKQDEVTYSSTTGEVYKSKSNGNRNHDPATTFGLPEAPNVEAPEIPPPDVQVTQDWTPDQPGIAVQNQITVITFIAAATFATPIPDPPPVNTEFYISVYDTDGNLLGDELHTATGSESIDAIITAMTTALQGVGGLSGFTITADLAANTITLEAAQSFICAQSFYQFVDGITHLMRTVNTQTYIPALAASAGQPRIARITLTDATTYPGNVYTLEMIGVDGVSHAVQYESTLFDSSAQILQGLVFAVQDSTDTFWETVQLAIDPANLTLDTSIFDNASTDVHIDAPAPPAGGAWWELVPFPLQLADQVIRGATADVLKEWGQFPEGVGEEQAVGVEAGIRSSSLSPSSTPLTEQTVQGSRYRVR